MNNKSILGHEQQQSQLARLLRTEKLSHALLFVGPAGLGKRQVARRVAQAFLCEQTQDGRHCGHCPACLWFDSHTHPDYVEVEPQGASLKIGQIREIQQQAALSSRNGQGRVFVINEAHTMTVEAQNSLLKVLEEPPEGVLFILITDQNQKLLPTILSRCQSVSFQSVPEGELKQWLAAQGFIEKVSLAARLSEGCPGKALAYLEPEGFHLWEKAQTFIESLLISTRPFQLVEIAEKLEPLDRLEWLRLIKLYCRDLYLSAQVSPAGFKQLALQPEAAESIQVDMTLLAGNILETINEIEQKFKANGNVRLILEAWILSLKRQMERKVASQRCKLS